MNLLLAVSLAAAPVQAGRPHPNPDLSLVIVITVDQLRPDYFSRFHGDFVGGFATILRSGALYDHGRQNHAITETGPGHSTVLSGREPASTGIVDNAHGVEDASAPLLAADPQPGASPRRFRGTELYDWLATQDPATRVLSVSRKDRGAILPVGRARAPVYWWSNGAFTTSRYYAGTLPAWVRAFNARGSARKLAAREWNLLLPGARYAEPDAEWYENGGKDVTFPHRLPSAAQIGGLLEEYPWMDSLTLAFALEGVRALDLGRDRHPDLLAVSLSATDAVGHRYGPDSREMHDHLLRLDRWLGWFLDSLAVEVPPSRTLLVLTADHGVQSYPERTSREGRVWLGDLMGEGMTFGSGLVSGDTAALHARGLRPDSLSRALAAKAAARRGVARVFTPASLAAAQPDDSGAMLWRNNLPRDFGWIIAAELEPGFVWSPAGSGAAEHGSTAADDVLVPIAFVGPGMPHATIHRTVRTVDIAPTLATLLGIAPAEPLDGVPLREIVEAAGR